MICISCPAPVPNESYTSTAIQEQAISCPVDLGFGKVSPFAGRQTIMSRPQTQQTLFTSDIVPGAVDAASKPDLPWLLPLVPQDTSQSTISSSDDFVLWDIDQTALESLASTSAQSTQSAYSPTCPPFASPRYGDDFQIPYSNDFSRSTHWTVNNPVPVSTAETPITMSKSESESTRSKEVGSNCIVGLLTQSNNQAEA